MTRQSKVRKGLLIALVAMVSYIPLAGVMTSYSVVAKEIKNVYKLSETLESAINSVAFGLTVGLCPFSSMLFIKYGYKKVALLGYGGTAISLVIAAYTSSSTVLFLAYSILFGTFNNFVYNSIISCTGEWLEGTKWVTSGTVLVSCGISLGTFLLNPVSKLLLDTFESEARAVFYRFLLCAGCALVGGCGFMFVADEPPSKARDARSEEGQQERLAFNDGDLAKKENLDFSILLDAKVWGWLIGTGLWSMIYTVPLTLGKEYITSQFYENPVDLSSNDTLLNTAQLMSADTAATILSMNGIMELATRFMCVALCPRVPNVAGIYGYIYCGACIVTGIFCFGVTLASSATMAWAFFLVLPFPLGVMNGMIYGGTENMFKKDVKNVWPFTNVLLAVGFAVGPIILKFVTEYFNAIAIAEGTETIGMHRGMQLNGILCIPAAIIMGAVGFCVSKPGG